MTWIVAFIARLLTRWFVPLDGDPPFEHAPTWQPPRPPDGRCDLHDTRWHGLDPCWLCVAGIPPIDKEAPVA